MHLQNKQTKDIRWTVSSGSSRFAREVLLPKERCFRPSFFLSPPCFLSCFTRSTTWHSGIDTRKEAQNLHVTVMNYFLTPPGLAFFLFLPCSLCCFPHSNNITLRHWHTQGGRPHAHVDTAETAAAAAASSSHQGADRWQGLSQLQAAPTLTGPMESQHAGDTAWCWFPACWYLIYYYSAVLVLCVLVQKIQCAWCWFPACWFGWYVQQGVTSLGVGLSNTAWCWFSACWFR